MSGKSYGDEGLSFLMLCLPCALGKDKDGRPQLACTSVTPIMLFTQESVRRPLYNIFIFMGFYLSCKNL